MKFNSLYGRWITRYALVLGNYCKWEECPRRPGTATDSHTPSAPQQQQLLCGIFHALFLARPPPRGHSLQPRRPFNGNRCVDNFFLFYYYNLSVNFILIKYKQWYIFILSHQSCQPEYYNNLFVYIILRLVTNQFYKAKSWKTVFHARFIDVFTTKL